MEWIRAASRKKRISLLLLLAVLCIACMPLTAFAHETTLTTTVPSQCPMKIEIIGNGKVEDVYKRQLRELLGTRPVAAKEFERG